MEQVLERIQKNKTSLKRQLNKLNVEYLKIIYKGFLQGKNAKQLGKELFDLTINTKQENYKGFDECLVLINQIKRKLL